MNVFFSKWSRIFFTILSASIIVSCGTTSSASPITQVPIENTKSVESISTDTPTDVPKQTPTSQQSLPEPGDPFVAPKTKITAQNIAQMVPLARIKLENTNYSVDFNPTQDLMAVASDSQITIYKISTREVITDVPVQQRWASFSSNGEYLFYSPNWSEWGALKTVDWTSLELTKLPSGGAGISLNGASPDVFANGAFMIIRGAAFVELWSILNSQAAFIGELKGFDNNGYGKLMTSQDQNYLAYVGAYNAFDNISLLVYDVGDVTDLSSFNQAFATPVLNFNVGTTFEYSDIAFSPNGKLMAVALDDGVRVWDLTTFEIVSQMPDSYLISFSLDGDVLFADGVAYSAKDGEKIVDLDIGVHSADFSSDGTILITAADYDGSDGMITYWGIP